MKKVVECYYVHKSNQKELENILSEQGKSVLYRAQCQLKNMNRSYNVIKYNKKNDSITLIQTIGWDKLYEPIIKETYKFSLVLDSLKISYRLNNKQVYHQKHLFVSPDYTGFDIEESKKRTALLETLPYVKNYKSKIGSLKYWNEVLDFYNLSASM